MRTHKRVIDILYPTAKTAEDLMKNFATLADAVLKAKPSAAKGTYLKSVYLTTTMGPGIKLDAKNTPAEVKEYVG